MQVGSSGMVAQVHSSAILSNDVLGARILVVTSIHQLLQSLKCTVSQQINDGHEVNADLSILNGVTISGKVRFCAMVRGTPIVSMGRLGSGVMTVRAEKSTRLPIKLPRMRPSLPFSRCLIDLSGRPPFWVA